MNANDFSLFMCFQSNTWEYIIRRISSQRNAIFCIGWNLSTSIRYFCCSLFCSHFSTSINHLVKRRRDFFECQFFFLFFFSFIFTWFKTCMCKRGRIGIDDFHGKLCVFYWFDTWLISNILVFVLLYKLKVNLFARLMCCCRIRMYTFGIEQKQIQLINNSFIKLI